MKKKTVRRKCVKVGYDCKGGTHKVDVGHGETVTLCDACHARWLKGK